MDAALRDSLASSAEKVDLIEEGGYQAARATSSERIERIVAAVERGLAEDDVDTIRRKRLLILLGELDDDELNLLNAYGRSYLGQDPDAFQRIIRPEPTHMQSSGIDNERVHLYELGKAHLIRLGLLKKNYGKPKKGQSLEFDTRIGDFKHSVEVSALGRILLKEIGLGEGVEIDC